MYLPPLCLFLTFAVFSPWPQTYPWGQMCQPPIPEPTADRSEHAQKDRGGGYHPPDGGSKPLRGSPRRKTKAFNCYCKCVFSPWVAWRSKSERSRRLLSDKNTIFLEALGGLGCFAPMLPVGGRGWGWGGGRGMRPQAGGWGECVSWQQEA